MLFVHYRMTMTVVVGRHDSASSLIRWTRLQNVPLQPCAHPYAAESPRPQPSGLSMADLYRESQANTSVGSRQEYSPRPGIVAFIFFVFPASRLGPHLLVLTYISGRLRRRQTGM
ncbi:hypothetical protein ACRALDRAFT_2032832 [Sodiomyces alcalophilus JCM 7366]|uniref:uncharacterized protein n=1 Tax=Sodiomyces alcalophilus JCM 7366 TaxID=591952 RepID=UPI0039B442D8